MLKARVEGIPCLIDVTSYSPILPCRSGHPDNWSPDEGGDLEYTICDRRGRPAPWLENKLDNQGFMDLDDWVLGALESELEIY